MKRLAIECLVAGAMLFPTLAAAQAEDAILRHHVQCFVAMTQVAMKPDPQARAAGAMAVNFFAGQIFGRSPEVDLAAVLRREARTLDHPKLAALAIECGNEMKRRGEQIGAAAQALRPAPPKATPGK